MCFEQRNRWPGTVFPYNTHYNDVTMDAIASQITIPTIVYSTVNSDADQRKHQSSASLAFVRGIHQGPVNSPHKWPVTRKMFPFDDVIICTRFAFCCVKFVVLYQLVSLPASFRVTSLTLGQYDCPSASDVTLEYMCKYIMTKTKQDKSIRKFDVICCS